MNNDKPIGWEEEFDNEFTTVTMGVPGGYGWNNIAKISPLLVRRFISRVEKEAYEHGKADAVGYIENSGLFDNDKGEIKESWVKELLEAARNQKMV